MWGRQKMATLCSIIIVKFEPILFNTLLPVSAYLKKNSKPTLGEFSETSLVDFILALHNIYND